MSDTAPFIKPTIPNNTEEETLPVQDILVTPDITNDRLSHCLSCENLNNDTTDIPKCRVCDCSISMLTTISFKTCPIGKW